MAILSPVLAGRRASIVDAVILPPPVRQMKRRIPNVVCVASWQQLSIRNLTIPGAVSIRDASMEHYAWAAG
jgi:hypothetical protein